MGKNVTKLSLLTQVYGQPHMLETFTNALRDWPEELAAQTELIVVDDCGDPAVDPAELQGLAPMEVQLLRHTKDIPWAQPACRNLALKYAKGKVLILLDPDMVIPGDRAAEFMCAAGALAPGQVTRFVLSEVNHPNPHLRGSINISSPNAWIVRRADLAAVGGYNEEFAGNKGWSDVELMHVLDSAYKVRQDKKLTVDFYRRSGLLPDADVRGLDRKVKTNHRTHAMHRETVRKKFKGNWHAWVKAQPPKKLNLPYVRLI
jgi:hypothetical protein